MQLKKTILLFLATCLLAGATSAFEPLFDTRIDYQVGSYPYSVFAADFDGDGQLDVAVTSTNPGAVSILRNNTDGTFSVVLTYAVGNSPQSVCAADFDGDGKIDIAVADISGYPYPGSIYVLKNNGNGTFASPVPYEAGVSPRSICAADVDGDGHADLVVANYNSGVTILKNNDNGTFAAGVGYGTGGQYPISVCAADFDGDGHIDLAVACYGSFIVSVLKNNGNGTFTQAVSYGVDNWVTSVVAADLDGDGHIDLAAAITGWPSNGVSILRNMGDGTFAGAQDFGAGSASQSVCAADFDGDNHIDLALADESSSSVSVLKNNGNGTFAPPVNFVVGFHPYSVFAADLDGDGKPDLATANSGSNSVSILDNNGNGTFLEAPARGVGNRPYSVFAADLDGDGKPDLAVANSGSDNVSVLKNFGSNTFADTVGYAVGTSPFSVFAVDFDGDGKPDLAVANYGSNTVSILKNNGNGTFAGVVNYGVGTGPYSVSAADFDGDGKADLAVANELSNSVSILKNNGNGTFASAANYSVGSYPTSVSAADFDGDGKPDLAIANSGGNSVSILKNNGNGIFASAVAYGVGNSSMGIFSADLDGDGKPDLAVANYGSNTVSILKNNGDGTFASAVNYGVGSFPYSVFVADFDSDGKPDLAVAKAYSNTVEILKNNGIGTFASPVNYGAGDYPISAFASDFDGDGRPDLVVANLNSNSVSVLTNRLGMLPPHLGISPTSVAFTAPSGGSLPSPQTISITNVGGGTLRWHASDDGTWLDISPTSGSGNTGSITLTANTTNLVAGSNSASVTITSSNADNSPQTVSVEYVVSPPLALAVDIRNLGDQFWVFTGISNDVQVQLTDANQHSVIAGSTGATVQVAFSNGDPAFGLRDDGVAPDLKANDGIYTGAWSPLTLGPVTLTASANLAGYVTGQSTVSGAVYIPVDASQLQTEVDRLRDAVKSYLLANYKLAFEVMNTGVNAIKANDGAQQYANRLSSALLGGASSAEINAIVGHAFPDAAVVNMTNRIIFAGQMLNLSNQLQKLVAVLQPNGAFSDDDLYSNTKLAPLDLSVATASSDQKLRRMTIPHYVPLGFPLGVLTTSVRMVAEDLEHAICAGLGGVDFATEANLYWRVPGRCDDASVELFSIGSEVSEARRFKQDLDALSNTRSIHQSVSSSCKVVSVAGPIARCLTAASAGTFAAVSAVQLGASTTCSILDFGYSDLEFKQEIKMHDFLLQFGSDWPNRLARAYQLYQRVYGDLNGLRGFGAESPCSTHWKANDASVCVFYLTGGRPEANCSIQITNSDNTLGGSASVFVELLLGDDPKQTTTLNIGESHTLNFGPGESKTFPITFDLPAQAVGRFKSYTIRFRVITSGRPMAYIDKRIDREFQYSVCASSQTLQSRQAQNTADSSRTLQDSVLAALSVFQTNYIPLPGTVQSTITLNWPSDSLLLDLYDASGHHAGWNYVSQTIENNIPGVSSIVLGHSPQVIKLAQFATAPFTIRVRSFATDTTEFAVSAFEEGPHPARLALSTDRILLTVTPGDSVLLGLSAFELGGQHSVTNISATLTQLTKGTRSIATTGVKLGVFPMTIPPDSAATIGGMLQIPDAQDTGAYSGTLKITGDAGSFQVPVSIEVKPNYSWCCTGKTGNVDCDPANGIDISDLSALVDYLYVSFTPLCCKAEANVDGSVDGNIDISDLSALVDYLYVSFTPPKACQ